MGIMKAGICRGTFKVSAAFVKRFIKFSFHPLKSDRKMYTSGKFFQGR